MPRPLVRLLMRLADGWRHGRRMAKARAPFVRRREYRIVETRHAQLAEAIRRGLLPASAAPIEARKPVGALAGEVCVFVTHAPQASLKSHVVHHVEALLGAGVQVVLVANTDLPLHELRVDAGLQERLSGLYVRANQGFDFAAWSHVLALADRSRWERLWLVNDSIVGPVDRAAFHAMVERVRGSDAELVGLTDHGRPVPHLQSYFLVFNARAMASAPFQALVHNVACLADKAQVIDVYEVRTTEAFRAAGLRAEALFERLPDGRSARGEMLRLWPELLAAGFPYVKTRVLQEHRNDPRVRDIRAAAMVDAQV